MTDLQRLFDDLIRWETELWNNLDGQLRNELDLPLSRFEPMQVIDRLGSCRVHDIARELSITVGGVSKLVDRIEAAELCQRRADPNDRRSSIITLTARGRSLLTAATAVFQRALELQVGAALPEGELAQFAGALARLRAHQAHAAAATSHTPGST